MFAVSRLYGKYQGQIGFVDLEPAHTEQSGKKAGKKHGGWNRWETKQPLHQWHKMQQGKEEQRQDQHQQGQAVFIPESCQDGLLKRTVDVGVITPTESGYYVRESDKIVIVSRSAIDALLGLLTNPPYLETPSPAPVTPEAGTPSRESATPQP